MVFACKLRTVLFNDRVISDFERISLVKMGNLALLDKGFLNIFADNTYDSLISLSSSGAPFRDGALLSFLPNVMFTSPGGPPRLPSGSRQARADA